MRLRALLWLLAVVALVLPPSVGPSAMTGVSSSRMMSDCHHPLPPPCPEKGSAKHAAGLCCPLMGQTMATLPPSVATGTADAFRFAAPLATARLAGLSPHQDPPPPRV
jgi:hypothetical protein